MLGYNEMLKRIKPSMVICYDEPFKSMTGNIKSFLPTTYEWTKDLDFKDLLQFKWEKQNKNISGLNKKDFKFFKYDDPYEKVDIKKCDVCGEIVEIDQFGNGDCKNCGWNQDASRLKNPNTIMYPNLISLNKAKERYLNKQPLIPDFNDFIEALFMYSEMMFQYNNTDYMVYLQNDNIIMNSMHNTEKFKNKEDFVNNANIDGILLKELWKDVKNANYLS